MYVIWSQQSDVSGIVFNKTVANSFFDEINRKIITMRNQSHFGS